MKFYNLMNIVKQILTKIKASFDTAQNVWCADN